MQARVPSSISVPNLKRRTLFVHQLLGGQKFRNWVMWRRPRPFRGSFYIPFVVVVRYYVRSVPRRQSSGQSSRAEFGRFVVAPVRPLRRAIHSLYVRLHLSAADGTTIRRRGRLSQDGHSSRRRQGRNPVVNLSFQFASHYVRNKKWIWVSTERRIGISAPRQCWKNPIFPISGYRCLDFRGLKFYRSSCANLKKQTIIRTVDLNIAAGLLN